MEPLVVANIINMTLGAATGVYLLWFFRRRPERKEVVWASVISFSAAVYALCQANLYLLGPSAAARLANQILYVSIVVLVHAVPSFAAALNKRPIKNWNRWAPISVVVWIALTLFTPWVVTHQTTELHFLLSPRPFPQFVASPLSALFLAYNLSVAAFGAFWLWKTRAAGEPMNTLFFVGFSIWVLAGCFDSLVVLRVVESSPMYFSEYGILLISLAIFGRGQREYADLLDAQKQTLDATKSSLHTLIEQSPEMIAVHRDGRFVYVNPAGASFLGYSPEELLGKEAIAVVDPRDRPVVIERMTHATETLALQPPMRERFLKKTGEVVVVEVKSIPVLFEDQPSLMVLARDFSERARIETRMMEMDRMVAIGTLAAGVAHEINNPLTFVLTNIELIDRALDDIKAAALGATADMVHLRELLDELRLVAADATEGARRIRDIVKDLSGLARDNELEVEPANLVAIIESAIRLTTNQLKHRTQLIREFETLPPVPADSARLSQVFINLLINAAQAIPVGNAHENEVCIRAVLDGESIVVSVRDTGTGIPADFIDRIFDPFVTSKSVGEGSGLGLSISRQIVTDHGGTITVESTVGQGTIFFVRLPCAVLPPEELVVESVPDDDVPTTRTSVLVIDDEEAVLRTLVRVIQTQHEAQGVTSARDALEKLEQGEHFDLILCDIMMPDVSGIEFFEQLCARWPERASSVLFMTGGTFSPESQAFVESLEHEPLAKPLEIDELLRRLSKSPAAL